MKRLFAAFERFGVEYLLISGQASILYGAATFSEDVDIWLGPGAANVRRLVRSLAACGAKVHKLTPPLEARWLRRGHGFHFVTPGPVYLDVMAYPPRAGGFAAAVARAARVASPWGSVPLVSIEELILLKRTRRLPDYEVISNLVRIRVDREAAPGRALLAWAARTTCRAEDRADYLARLGRPGAVESCRRQIAAEVARMQSADARYWSRRVDDLRKLRRRGALLREGMAVRELAGRRP